MLYIRTIEIVHMHTEADTGGGGHGGPVPPLGPENNCWITNGQLGIAEGIVGC